MPKSPSLVYFVLVDVGVCFGELREGEDVDIVVTILTRAQWLLVINLLVVKLVFAEFPPRQCA